MTEHQEDQETEQEKLAGERIQKVLSNAGIGSRRQVEDWVRAGRIQVNREPAMIGMRITPADEIRLNGDQIHPFQKREQMQRTRVLLYNKPAGQVTSRKDEKGRKTVFDHLPRIQGGRWIAIGRLDINTMGLLLFTNDGQLANKLMHPSTQVDREYAVRILGTATAAQLTQLREGVELEDGVARFNDVVDSGNEGEGVNHWYHVVLQEGRNRAVRRMWEAVGLTVSRLMRVRFGTIFLTNRVRMGKFVELSPEEVASLQELAGLEPDTEPKRAMLKLKSSKRFLPPKEWEERGKRSSGSKNARFRDQQKGHRGRDRNHDRDDQRKGGKNGTRWGKNEDRKRSRGDEWEHRPSRNNASDPYARSRQVRNEKAGAGDRGRGRGSGGSKYNKR